MPAPPTSTSASRNVSGSLFALLAFAMWGILPLYWHLLEHAGPMLVLAHRIVWALVFSAILLVVSGRIGELRIALSNKKSALMLLFAAVLITFNWGLYIWAVQNGMVLETSLGYFMNPLMSVLLGIFFLKEKLTLFQSLALVLAAAGVATELLAYGSIPWLGLGLAASFALYGLCKKTIQAESLVSLTAETLFALPLSLLLFMWTYSMGQSAPDSEAILITAVAPVQTTIHPDWLTVVLLAGAGPVTALPLLSFGKAAKLIPLSRIGFFQYLSPSIGLVLGVSFFHEHFGTTEILSFSLIWAGLVVFMIDQYRNRRRSAGGSAE